MAELMSDEFVKLKRCPCCGGAARMCKLPTYIGIYSVFCNKCYLTTKLYQNQIDAIEAWNNRVADKLIHRGKRR